MIVEKGYFVLIIDDQVLFFVDFWVEIPLFLQSVGEDLQILFPVVPGLRAEEGYVKITPVVIDGASAGITASQLDAHLVQTVDVSLCPGVLVTSYDDAGVVPPQQHDVVVGEVQVLIHPVLKSQIGVDISALRDEHGLGDAFVRYVRR